jgi:hypothetical protein
MEEDQEGPIGYLEKIKSGFWVFRAGKYPRPGPMLSSIGRRSMLEARIFPTLETFDTGDEPA